MIRVLKTSMMEGMYRTHGGGLSIVQEGVGDSLRKHIEGAYVSMSRRNRNNRYYTPENFMPMFDSYMEEWVLANRAMGELTHPGKPFINPLNVCIKIVDAKRGFEGDNDLIWGKSVVMNTPYGKLLSAILDDCVMGVSSRCRAIIHSNGWTEVEEIVTLADVVVDPSAREAMMNVVEEQFDFLTGGIPQTQRLFDQFLKDKSKAGSNDLVDLALSRTFNRINHAISLKV